MSLFERIKNIRRNNLQEEKMKFPGGTGDIGFNAPKRGEKVKKRLDRADKLGTPDPFDPDYDKKVIKTDKRRKIGKKVSSAFETPKKSDLKKLDKQPGGYRAPASGFGKGVTPGEFRVKQMDKKSFVKTPAVEYDPIKQPRGIKIPGKTYRKFKTTGTGTRNISSMNPSEMQRAFGTSSTEGGAGASGSSKTQPQKPKKTAADFTKEINQKNKNRKEFTGNKKTFSAFKKQADSATNKLVSQREVARSTTGTKDVKKIRDINKQIKATERISKGYDLASKGKGLSNAPVVASDLKTVTDNTPKVTTNVTQPPKDKVLPGTRQPKKIVKKIKPKRVATGITKSGNISYATKRPPAMKLSKTNLAIVKRETSKALTKPENVKYAVAASKRKGLAKGLTRFVGKLGPKGRLAATVLGAGSYLATKPGVRKFVRNVAIGTGLAGALGFAANKEKVLKKGDGLKPIGKVDVRYGLTGSSKKGQGGKIYNPKQMAQVGKVQKNFIDKYNQKAARNPFKKQIQYKPKADGTYKILDPKKK